MEKHNLKVRYKNNKELWLKDLNYYKGLGCTVNAGIDNEGYWLRTSGFDVFIKSLLRFGSVV